MNESRKKKTYNIHIFWIAPLLVNLHFSVRAYQLIALVVSNFGLSLFFYISLMNFIFRYVAAELATDMVINVGDVKFYLHKVCNVSHSMFVNRFLHEK